MPTSIKSEKKKFSSIAPYQEADDNIKEDVEASGSLLDKEVEGLLNWAEALPDEQESPFKNSGSSFFKKGII